LEKAAGEILFFGNADCRPEAGFLAAHGARLSGLPGKSLVLGSSPWESPAARGETATVFDELLAHTPMVFFFDRLAAHQWYDFRHAWTLNLSVRRADAAGGFCERLRPVYFEDLAFAHRLLGAEKKGVFYEPAAKVTHRHPTTWEQYLDREELLGLMTPVLATEAPEVFAALHGGAAAEELAAAYRGWSKMDASTHEWIYMRMKAWAGRPASVLDGVASADRQAFLESLYQMHVPLKRLAFRLGYLRGMELRDPAQWEERVAKGLWRAVAIPAGAKK
jgi:hypothetical protein